MNTRRSAPVPWLARARAIAQKVGLDPRYLRRLRWMLKAQSVRRNGASLARHWRFVISSPEPHNFTFEIANLDELAQWAGAVAGCDPELAAALIAEPTDDQLLAQRLRSATEGRWWWSKPEPQFGKRLGWYALTRILRPRLTIEVGVHDGLGSLLLLRALERNQEGGHGGELVSLDVNPAAGWLVGSHPLWELRIQSSEAGLPAVLRGERELDLF